MNDIDIPDFFNELKSIIIDANRYAQVTGVNFFKQNFRRQGFLNNSLEPWRKKSSNTSNSLILVQSGRLRDSLHAESNRPDRIVFMPGDLPYADIHNNGGKIAVTAKMKRYFWYLYNKSIGKQKGRKKKNGELREDKANARYSQLAEFYKSMALKKVGSYIQIPKRQYIGESASLMKQLDQWLEQEIDKRFK